MNELLASGDKPNINLLLNDLLIVIIVIRITNDEVIRGPDYSV